MLVGQHLLVECRGQHAHLSDIQLKTLMSKAALAGGATILFDHFHKFGGHGGITGVLLLAESHITVHTWPELDYAAFDIFMCGEAFPLKAANTIAEHFPESDVVIRTLDRGFSPASDKHPKPSSEMSAATYNLLTKSVLPNV